MSFTLEIALIIVALILIVFSAFFSAAETAYSSVSQSKIETSAKNKKRASLLIQKHYSKFGWTLSTILIFNNLVNIAASTLVAYLFSNIMTNQVMATIVATFVMTPIIVILGEIIPKLLAKKYSFGYLTKIAYVMETLNWVFFPLTFPLSKLALSSKVTNTETEIKTMIDLANREGVLEKREATLAKNALDLDSSKIHNIMTSRKSVKTVSIEATISKALEIFAKTGHSRLPVTKKDIYVGVVLLKDIFRVSEGNVSDYVLSVPYISKNSIATKALEKMRKLKTHIAFVSSSKSATKVLGIITIEDIIEEIVGEIYDEHDASKSVREIGLHKLFAIGSASMKELETISKQKFEDSKDVSIRQWLQSRINRTIKTGLTYTYKNKYMFKITSNKNGQETEIEITQK